MTGAGQITDALMQLRRPPRNDRRVSCATERAMDDRTRWPAATGWRRVAAGPVCRAIDPAVPAL